MSIIQVKTNEQIDTDAEKARLEDSIIITNAVPLESLAGYVLSCWQESRDAKRNIEDEMELALKARNGEYTDKKLMEIKSHGGSEIFMRLIDEKSTAAKAWLNEIALQGKSWGISPTPLPELPEAMDQAVEQEVLAEFQEMVQLGMVDQQAIESRQQELKLEIQNKTFKLAQKEQNLIESKLEDLLIESNWYGALKEVLEDVVDLHCGILKGPIVKRRAELVWEVDKDGRNIPMPQQKFVIDFERVSPFNIYPSPVATGINDGYIIEKHRLTRSSIYSMRDVPGYNKEHIDMVLEESAHGQLNNWLDNVETTYGTTFEQDKDHQYKTPAYDAKIEALQLWGKISGKRLKEFGIAIKDERADYEAEVWLIGRHVIKAELNGDPLGRRPYCKASFRNRNGSFWGEGLPATIYDIQEMVNAAARNLVNNMAFASGPMTGIDISRLAEGESPTGLHPNRIFQFDETMNVSSGGRPPLWFFQPKALVGELVRVYEFFSNEADNKTGIPKYSYGSGGSKGALGTATGMSMMMSNASRGIKQVVGNVDDGIIAESVRRVYEWLLMYANEDDAYPVDLKVVAKGSTALMAKEQQQVRRGEFLNIALNPQVLEIIGRNGLAAILRTVSEGLDFGVDDIVPTQSELDKQEFQAQQEAQMMQEMQQTEQMAAGSEVMPDGSKAGGGDASAFKQGGPIA